MNIIKLLLAFGLLGISNSAFGQINVSINIAMDRVKVDFSTPIPAGSQFFLVADTNNDGFDFLPNSNFGTDSGSIIINSFFFDSGGQVGFGDDLILYRGSEGGGSDFEGYIAATTGSLQLGPYGAGAATWDGGDDLAVVWFPEYRTLTSSLMAGDIYGIHSPDVGSEYELSDEWVTPTSTFSNYRLTALTSDSNEGPNTVGALGPNVLIADQSVIPEPSTYALILGTVGLALVYLKRRKAANEL